MFINNIGNIVILMDYGTTVRERTYGLATWFLVSQGKD